METPAPDVPSIRDKEKENRPPASRRQGRAGEGLYEGQRAAPGGGPRSVGGSERSPWSAAMAADRRLGRVLLEGPQGPRTDRRRTPHSRIGPPSALGDARLAATTTPARPLAPH